MEDTLGLSLSHATETAAIASARVMGCGDNHFADQQAVEAMRQYLNTISFAGKVVIGEGERDEAPMLYIGEKLGTGEESDPSHNVDIAVDPLENTNATASGGPNAISVLAASERGGLLHAPDLYMNKLVVGPESAGKVSITDPVKKTVSTIAKSLGYQPSDLVIVVLDRPRHEDLVAQIRATGARIKLIPDGDLSAGIAVPIRGTGVHAAMGIGAAPEGVITAAALRCLKGEIQAQFWPRDTSDKHKLKQAKIKLNHIYTTKELASGKNILFSASGVTDGDLLRGVRFFAGGARTHSLVISNQSAKIRLIDTTHVFDKKQIKYHL